MGKGDVVTDDVITLSRPESVRLEGERLGILLRQMSPNDLEDMLCRAVEELAIRLSQCHVLWRQKDGDGLYKCARSLVGISEQIGMGALAQAARHVTDCVNQGDDVAIAATVARLVRIGESSLNAVWDLQDLSV